MKPFNIQMMQLIISLFALIFFFNPEQVVCFSTYEAPSIPSEPAVDPRSPLLPPPPPSPPDSPVPEASSPEEDCSPSSCPDALPPFHPKQYVNFPVPSFWNRPLSAPSPRRMPKPPSPSPSPSPSQKSPPTIALSRGQILSEIPRSDSLFSRNSKHYLPSSIQSETNNNPEIKKICNSTDRPALCLKFITPLYSSDKMSVLDNAIKATVYQIKLAIAGITKLAKPPTLLSTKESDYEDCKESYKDALENLQNAKNAIPKRDIGTINSMLSAAVTDFSDCDDFSNNPFIVKFDDVLRDLVSICLVIASSIK